MFAYPFRIFFLSAAAWAVLAIPLWLAQFSAWTGPSLAMPALYWHQHEMIFGFLNAAIAGFLLTAVCVWTQTERTHGLRLALLWGVWLGGRVLMALGGDLPVWLVQSVNLAFLPLVMVDAGARILMARQRRQLVLLAVLGLLWSMQLGFVLAPGGHFGEGGLIMASALMLVVGGRITPAFSASWLKAHGGNPEAVRQSSALDVLLLASMGLLLLSVLFGAGVAIIAFATLAAALGLLRLWWWRGWQTRREPLLWVLHLSLLWIPVGLLLLVAREMGWIAGGAWMHAIGIGAMGGLILGVMSRVALGHTGRPLQLPAGMVTAFALIHIGAVLRLLVTLQWLPWTGGIHASATCWTLAFVLFLWRYAAILASPRVDGKPG